MIKRLRYWIFCWRHKYGQQLTYEQWEFMDFMGRAYRKTIDKERQ